MGAHDAFVELQGVMNVIAVSLTKLGNDIRLLGSGPRSGLGRADRAGGRALLLDHAGQDQPDPGGGADHGLRPGDGQPPPSTSPAAQSFLELNVFKPVIIQAVLQSASCWPMRRRASPRTWCEAGAEPRAAGREPGKSLMLVTALNPHIGYDKAVRIGKKALAENLTLRDAAQQLGFVTPEDFDRWVRPEDMGRPAPRWREVAAAACGSAASNLAGHRTSVALEPEFWAALAGIAEARGVALSALVADVDAERQPDQPLASSLRIFALRSRP